MVILMPLKNKQFIGTVDMHNHTRIFICPLSLRVIKDAVRGQKHLSLRQFMVKDFAHLLMNLMGSFNSKILIPLF